MKLGMRLMIMFAVMILCLCVPAGAAFPGEEIPDSEIVNVKSVRLNRTCVVLPVYKSTKLTKIVMPRNATNKRAKWYCSNPAVIRLTQRGYVISKKPGRSMVTVVAEDHGIAASCLVTVLPVTAAGRRVKYKASDYMIRLG